MHPEEKKLIEKMEEAFGPDVVKSMHPEELGASMIDTTGVMILTMNAGEAKEAADMALAANEAVERNPEIKFLFGINGCELDPREIDQIPEARISLRTLFEALSRKAFWRFDIEHQALMLVAMNLGQRTGDQLHVPPWMVKKP